MNNEFNITVGEFEQKYNTEEYEFWCEETNTWKKYKTELFNKSSGFPRPEIAAHPINAICIHEMISNTYKVFGLGQYTNTNPQVNYEFCKDEETLLEQFIDYVNKENPNIWTGWNIVNFDIPYLVNRINQLLGRKQLERLSPERKIKTHESTSSDGKVTLSYSFLGSTIWDYIELYKKFQLDPRESYSLDFIATYELGEGKLEYKDKTKDLYTLARDDFQTFINYNIKDTTLVYDLNEKLKFVELAISVMYQMKCQPDSIFGTVTPWDALLYCELLKRKKLAPAHRQNYKEEFLGGYVKSPVKGLHSWLTVYDIVSSYPNSIISYNISPETIINDDRLTSELRQVRKYFDHVDKTLENYENLDKITPILKKHNVIMSPNGNFYSKDKIGFIPEISNTLFSKRKDIKKQMKAATGDEKKQLDLVQHSIKISLNSLYGAMSNIYFRYFDLRMASSVTHAGQLSARSAYAMIDKNFPLITTIYGDTDSVESSSIVEINGKLDTIENHFNTLNGDLIIRNDKEYKVGNFISPCFTENIIENKKVKSIYRHKVSNKTKWKIKSKSGKEIIITGDHSIMVERNNILIEIKPQDLHMTDILIEIG